MPTDTTIQAMFTLAHVLHPERDMACQVTLEACDWCVLSRHPQDRRPHAAKLGPYKLKIPEDLLPQVGVYVVSEWWEREQEASCTPKRSRYCPTSADRLVRYLKCVIWRTMDRPSYWAAVAIGCFLYRYRPSDIVRLAPDCFPEANIRRVKKNIHDILVQRFTDAPVDDCRCPAKPERQLIHDALAALAPWTPCHAPQSCEATLLDTYFGLEAVDCEAIDREIADRTRIHILYDPACAGFPRFIHEYNREMPMAFKDPDDMLSIPNFTNGPPPDDADPPPTASNRFHPQPLTTTELRLMQHGQRRLRRRRRQYRVDRGSLRVCVDGVEQARFEAGGRAWPPFTVPRNAIAVELIGQDASGDLRLAVFLLPNMATVTSEGIELGVTLESGQTVTLELMPIQDDTHDVMAAYGRLIDTEMPATLKAAVVTFVRNARARWGAVVMEPRQRVRKPTGWRWALSVGLLMSLSVNVWLGFRAFGPHQLAAPRVATSGHIDQFQQEMQHADAFSALISPDIARPPQDYRFAPLPARTLMFHIGTGYAATLAWLRSGDVERAVSHLDGLVQALQRVHAPAVLTAYMQAMQSHIQSRQERDTVSAQLLAAFEALYETAYQEADKAEGLTYFRAGAWLVNLSLAAHTRDRKALRQGPVVQALQHVLTADVTFPPEVRDKLAQLHHLVTRSSLTEPHIRTIDRLVQDVQRMLSD